MVDKSGYVALLGGVNELVCSECHEVEVCRAVLAILLAAAPEFTLVKHLAHILQDERAPGDRTYSQQLPTKHSFYKTASSD